MSRVDENVIYSCCSVFSNACQLIYNWHHQAMAKHNIKKILYFFILFEIKQVYIEIASHYHILLRTSLVYSISFKRFSNSFTSTFGGLYVKLRIMFFDFWFVISRNNDSMTSQIIDRYCLVLQQNDSLTRCTPPPLRYCIWWEKKVNLSSVIPLKIHTMFQKDK